MANLLAVAGWQVNRRLGDFTRLVPVGDPEGGLPGWEAAPTEEGGGGGGEEGAQGQARPAAAGGGGGVAEAGGRAREDEGKGAEDAPPPAGQNEVADVLRRAGLPD